MLEGKFELGLFRLLYFRTPLLSVASSVTWDTALVTTSAPRLLAWFCNNMVCFYIICAKNWVLSKVVPQHLETTSWSNCSFPAFISEVDTKYIFRVLSIPLDPFQELGETRLASNSHPKVIRIGMVNENNILNYIVIHDPIFWHRKFFKWCWSQCQSWAVVWIVVNTFLWFLFQPIRLNEITTADSTVQRCASLSLDMERNIRMIRYQYYKDIFISYVLLRFTGLSVHPMEPPISPSPMNANCRYRQLWQV